MPGQEGEGSESVIQSPLFSQPLKGSPKGTHCRNLTCWRLTMVVQDRRHFELLLEVVVGLLAAFAFTVNGCSGGELSESKPLIDFIRALDPENVLRTKWNGLAPCPCSHRWKGVECNLQGTTIRTIRLENLNLGGIIDAESLCKLPNLRVLSLAGNQIRGTLSESILNCTSLIYLNLSSNLLNGTVRMVALTKLKSLKRFDISNNHFTASVQHFKQESKLLSKYSNESRESEANGTPPISGRDKHDLIKRPITWETWLPLTLGIVFFLLFAFYVMRKEAKVAKERETLKFLASSTAQSPPPKDVEEVKPEERRFELVFFVEEEERFELEDLLEAAADLQNQGLWSSLYKVKLKNNAVFAVKRLKKLKASFEEFGQTMRKIGSLKHQNILPLVAYNSTNEEKLLIYRYQSNGSLLTLLENYVEGKKDFPWKLRLSIAVGIARGLDFIYQRSDELGIIPHGNIKLSNILLNENEEPLISEYGYSKFVDPSKSCLFNSNGYRAPEKCLSEQGDVYSFGVILLELLTGKVVEKSGLDLPKWVKSMVREEWTGEVFDKEIAKVGMYAFPLLNISLKCVSHFPESRPGITEVLEKIEEIVNAHHYHSSSSVSSMDFN